MRLIAISILILAGAVMAAAGTLAESLPDARRYNVVDEWGLGIVALGGLLLLSELYNWNRFSSSSSESQFKTRVGA